MGLEELGLVLSLLGVAGTVLICALPMWKVTAFIGTQLVVMQVFWEGLWMTCVSEYTGQMQCKIYDALLDLEPELQAARGLVCVALVLGCLAFLLFLLGARCTNCLGGARAKLRVVAAAGLAFALGGLAALTAVSLTARDVVRDFRDPRVPDVLKKELGAALYIGWAAGALLLAGGALLLAGGALMGATGGQGGRGGGGGGGRAEGGGGGYREAAASSGMAPSGYAFRNYV